MAAYVKLQRKEFNSEELGYQAVNHQRGSNGLASSTRTRESLQEVNVPQQLWMGRQSAQLTEKPEVLKEVSSMKKKEQLERRT